MLMVMITMDMVNMTMLVVMTTVAMMSTNALIVTIIVTIIVTMMTTMMMETLFQLRKSSLAIYGRGPNGHVDALRLMPMG